jgi:hypothetical protein
VPCARSRCPLDAVCGKHGLDIVPQRLVDNRRVFPGIGIAFLWYLAAEGEPTTRGGIGRSFMMPALAPGAEHVSSNKKNASFPLSRASMQKGCKWRSGLEAGAVASVAGR